MTCRHGFLHIVVRAAAQRTWQHVPHRLSVAPYMNDKRIVAKAFEPNYDPPKAGRSTIDFPEAQWVPVSVHA